MFIHALAIKITFSTLFLYIFALFLRFWDVFDQNTMHCSETRVINVNANVNVNAFTFVYETRKRVYVTYRSRIPGRDCYFLGPAGSGVRELT